MFQRIPNFVLALISGILLSAGWFAPFTVFMFLGFVPLLIIEDRISTSETIKRKKLHLTTYSYLAFIVWNLSVTWWLFYASIEGACLAIICNPIFMCITFMAWHNLKKRLNKSWAIWMLIPIWLAYEYGHTLWDLSWSWLVLGNSFSSAINLIQWYEFTGTSGGSLWILAVNILLFQFIKNKEYSFKKIAKPLAVIIIPIALSYAIYYIGKTPVDTKKTSYKTLIIQPNVDPYNEKFYFEPSKQLHKLQSQLSTLDSTVDFLVLPETYLTESIFEGEEFNSYSFSFLRDSILRLYPKLTIICGSNTNYAFKQNEPLTSTARKFSDADSYYDSFNTGIQYNNESGIKLYHKSKLVPGVERMPFPALFRPLESLAIDLGGTFGSQGTQEERTVFFSHNHKVGIAPVICYESVYSDYVTGYIRNGANLIFVITNDGWWSDSPGHKQHLALSQLRAIETRREIARCANTGISCFITPYGELEQATPYWQDAAITKNMLPNDKLTLFVRFGDIISYCSTLLAILLLIWSQYLRFKKS